jgi:sugar phosphate isomerase/epimerase
MREGKGGAGLPFHARELASDYAGTLRRPKAMGYSHFGLPLGPQSPRHPAPRDPHEVAALCTASGLKVGVLRLAHTDDYPRQMQTAARIGASIAGVDPLFLVRDLDPRVLSLHPNDVLQGCDDRDCRRFVAPGEGDLDYRALIPELDRITDALACVEVDDPVDGLEAAARGAMTVLRARARS